MSCTACLQGPPEAFLLLPSPSSRCWIVECYQTWVSALAPSAFSGWSRWHVHRQFVPGKDVAVSGLVDFDCVGLNSQMHILKLEALLSVSILGLLPRNPQQVWLCHYIRCSLMYWCKVVGRPKSFQSLLALSTTTMRVSCRILNCRVKRHFSVCSTPPLHSTAAHICSMPISMCCHLNLAERICASAEHLQKASQPMCPSSGATDLLVPPHYMAAYQGQIRSACFLHEGLWIS